MIKEILEYDRKPDISAKVSGEDWIMTISTINRIFPDYDEMKAYRSILDKMLNTELYIRFIGPSNSNIISSVGSELSRIFPYFKIRFIKSKAQSLENSRRVIFILRMAVPRRHYPKVYRKILELKLSE